jgi:hypothetical protein
MLLKLCYYKLPSVNVKDEIYVIGTWLLALIVLLSERQAGSNFDVFYGPLYGPQYLWDRFEPWARRVCMRGEHLA